MRRRILGATGWSVSEFALGTMMFGAMGNTDHDDSIRIIRSALDSGINFLDTADVYSLGESEEIVGRALEGRREDVVLATKFGLPFGDDPNKSGGSRRWIVREVENSLRRLGTDYIDLYYQHRVDKSVPIEDTVGAMAELVSEGKVRYLGLSEASPQTIRRAHAVHPISALQTEYSLWSRDPEQAILPTVRELGIGFVAYSPLGRGFLSGKYKKPEDLPEDDFRRHHPRFQGENFEKNLELVQRIEQIAAEKQVTAGQLALAWVLSRGEDIVAIPGTKRRSYLEENVAAAEIDLSENDLARIDEAAPLGVTAGDRYASMATIDA